MLNLMCNKNLLKLLYGFLLITSCINAAPGAFAAHFPKESASTENLMRLSSALKNHIAILEKKMEAHIAEYAAQGKDALPLKKLQVILPRIYDEMMQAQEEHNNAHNSGDALRIEQTNLRVKKVLANFLALQEHYKDNAPSLKYLYGIVQQLHKFTTKLNIVRALLSIEEYCNQEPGTTFCCARHMEAMLEFAP